MEQARRRHGRGNLASDPSLGKPSRERFVSEFLGAPYVIQQNFPRKNASYRCFALQEPHELRERQMSVSLSTSSVADHPTVPLLGLKYERDLIGPCQQVRACPNDEFFYLRGELESARRRYFGVAETQRL